MPTGLHAVCRTLLTDGQTRCSALVKPGRQSCSKHAPAYDASYERYKRAEEKAKDFRAAAQTKRGDVHTIPSEDIRPRIENVRAYIKALESELWLRREHDVRFIGNPDEGHRKRLYALEKQLTHHRDIVEALRARLQRLKPESDSSPPKHRPRHRHTLSDPTPQPAPSVARSPRKRSRGRQKEQRGVHRRGRSEQSGSKKQDEDPFASTEHRKGVSKEGDGFDGVSVPSGPTLRESEGAWVGDRLERGSGVVSSGGDEGEQGADGDRRAESIVVGHRHGIIPSDDGATLHAIVEAVNMGSQPYLPTELDRATRMATNGADTALQPSEIDDTLVSTCAEPPSPLLQTVGEYTEACPESQETGSGEGEKPGTGHHGRFWKYALTAILPVTVIVLKCTLAVIRKRTSRL